MTKTDTTKQSRHDLARAATAILRRANCDAISGEVKGKAYQRNKRAKDKVSLRRWKERQAKLGHSFGAASPARNIEVEVDE
jgi:hypothetical protein